MLTNINEKWLAVANSLNGGYPLTKEEWLAIKHNDKEYDGRLYYALKKSRKVCRPSCPKQHLHPEKVIVFQTLQQALALGYQPCAKCRPEREHWAGARAELANAAQKLVEETYRDKFSLDALAKELFVDKSYLLRTFKEIKGHTLLEYHNLVRCEKAKELLQRPELSVSYIASAAGYVSASHFTQVFRRMTGQTPSRYRAAYLRSLDE